MQSYNNWIIALRAPGLNPTFILNWIICSSESIKNLTQIIQFKIKEASLESLSESDSGPSYDDSNLEKLVAALISIKKRHYLAKQVRLERPPDITTYLFRLDTARFKQEFRMSQESFLKLVLLIEGHPVFHNNSNFPQRPIQDQLTVTLRQMGMFGKGTLVGVLACFFRISEGSVILYCSQVVQAIFSLERLGFESGTRFTGFKNCQKGMYGLATLIFCNEEKQIIYYLMGWPGCSHETHLREDSDRHLQEGKLFSLGQYLLADSGFPTKSNLVPAFKTWPHQIPRLQKKFNQHLASLRVCKKHCIGILNGRFQLLQGLRLELTSVESMGWCMCNPPQLLSARQDTLNCHG
ncbi:hypothetical protein VP01_1288g5 [Puccinia sorghi]|uniref:DDE Tnp4 domain-containing protein n=1 Tax=Puccinia sorghi TaxID=27349 RepID=A0A0L6VNH5_9BASI|nr:hypothetical protein VP01_1288g5 [Puccinia sorghi]